ncbi:MAG: hypothetical protein IJ133_06330, partial [Clostridia bacterium]|nr:hypothetical protein [Clostridia bacterium]
MRQRFKQGIAMMLALLMMLTIGSIAAVAVTETPCKPNFKQYLAPERIPVDPPESLVDKNGKAVFGTFNGEIKNINLTDIKGQSNLPDAMNSMRLTTWEALEVDTKDFTFLSAISPMMGVACVNLTLLY